MMDSILGFAAANELIVLGVLALLVLIIVAVMALTLARMGRAPATPDDKADLDLLAIPTSGVEAEQRSELVAASRSLRRIMKDGLAAYRECYVRNPYLMPWALRIGGEDDGGLLAAQEDIHPSIGVAERDGATWHFYRHGVIIDAVTDAAIAETLKFASRRRAALPLDGVIVTVPVSALSDVRAATARGTEIYNRLWTIQRQLGFALPVYVVIGGNESLEGFRAFEEMLPEGLRNGMLGWSSPYAMESAFTPDYVSEALRSLYQAMLATMLEAFGSVVESELGARLMGVREEMGALEQPLRTLLEVAFRRTAYQESLYFRGIYFIARHHPDAPASFARDLIDDKVFPESGLSKPLRANLRSRRVLNYAWPAAAGIVAAASIWISVARVENYRNVVVPVLRATGSDIDAIASSRGGATFSVDAEADAAVRFLRNAAVLDRSEPVVMVPLSWFGSDPYQVRAAMQAGWQRIVLHALKRRIEARIQALPTPPNDGSAPDEAFVKFMGSAVEDDNALQTFNNLLRNDRAVSLPGLLNFALGVNVAPSLLDKLASWGVIGPDAKPIDDPNMRIDPSLYQEANLSAFGNLADAYFLQLSQGGQLGARLISVAREVGVLASGGQSGATAIDGFNETWSGLNDIANQLSSSRPTWIGAGRAEIPADVDGIINGVSKTLLVGPRARQAANDVARRRFNEVKDQVANVYSVIGPLVTRQANGSASLSPAADALRQVLGQWLVRPFMTPSPVVAAAVSPTGGAGSANTDWDQAALDAIPPLFDDYLLFQAKQLPQVPQPLGPSVRAAAQFRLQQTVNTDLARAIPNFDVQATTATGRLSALRNWSRSLRAAFPVLEQTMQTYSQIGLQSSADAVQRRVNMAASSILNQVDDVIRQDQLYIPSRFYLADWRSGPVNPPGLFGQSDQAALAQLLASSRAEMSTLARDIVGPLLDLLSRPVMQGSEAAALASKWNAIMASLDQYDASRPNSSLKLLEQFITEDVAKVDDKNCAALPATFTNSGDFFVQRLNAIKTSLRQRCAGLGDDNLFAGYSQIENFFNEKLAGHAPFARIDGGTDAPDAAIADIQDFYAIFDAHSDDVVKRLAAQAGTRADLRDLARFTASMTTLRPLLLQIAAPAAGTSLQVVPDFRVNRDKEVGGADIIEWQLWTEDRNLSSFAPPGALSWSPGDRVAVALRWAKDAPVAPTPSGNGKVPRVDGPTAWFEQGGQWALLEFLTNHASAATARSPRPVEEFDVPISNRTGTPSGATGQAGQPAVARVYMGVQLKRTGTADGKPVNDFLAFTALPAAAPRMVLRRPLPPSDASLFQGSGGAGIAGRGDLAPTSTDRAIFGLDRTPPGLRTEPLTILPQPITPQGGANGR